MIAFQLPPADELHKAGKDGRINIFRQYFASSRYNRLLIQQTLVRSCRDSSLAPKVTSMEESHNKDFAQTVSKVKKYGYLAEFLDAVREEDDALQKIIEAYDRRMHSA
jgi:hypothetical protein